MPTVIVFTDGGCRKNGSGAWAIYIENGGNVLLYAGTETGTTTNRMELKAVITALEALRRATVPTKIHSDSAYVVNGVVEGWAYDARENGWRTTQDNPLANKDLWCKLLDLLDNMPKTELHWVERDSDYRNAEADALLNHCRELAERVRFQNGQ